MKSQITKTEVSGFSVQFSVFGVRSAAADAMFAGLVFSDSVIQ